MSSDAVHPMSVDEDTPPPVLEAQRVSNETGPKSIVSKLQQLIFTKNVQSVPGNRDVKMEDKEAEKKSTASDDKALVRKQISSTNMEEKRIEQMWEALRENSSNFKGWTYLIRMVEKQNNIDNIKNVYSAFLKCYPNCDDYWKKYVEYEKRSNDLLKLEKVIKSGIAAVPAGVDLWMCYITYLKTIGADVARIRNAYKNSLRICGFHFCSDQLWNDYIKWELDHNEFFNAFKVYFRLVATPTKGYLQNFKNFDLFLRKVSFDINTEMIEYLKYMKILDDSIIPPEDLTLNVNNLEETVIKKRIILSSLKMYKGTDLKFKQRQKFEENIKIPHFNGNKLDASQIENWENFIDFEKTHTNINRIICVYERCLVPCAFIESFWLSYLDFLDSIDNSALYQEFKSGVLRRACCVYHPKSLELNLKYSDHEESNGRFEHAVKILFYIEKEHATSIEIATRLINLYRRKDHDAQNALYERYLSKADEDGGYSKKFISEIAIKYANVVWKHDDKIHEALKILDDVIHKYQICVMDVPEIYLKVVEIKMDKFPRDVDGVLKEFDDILNVEGLSARIAYMFAKKRMEFVEYNTRDYNMLQSATSDYNYYKEKYDEEMEFF